MRFEGVEGRGGGTSRQRWNRPRWLLTAAVGRRGQQCAETGGTDRRDLHAGSGKGGGGHTRRHIWRR